MDGPKFDDLIRGICTTRLTRWGALRGLVAGAAAAVTGSALIADDTDAKGKKGRAGAKNKGGKGGKKKDAKKNAKKKNATSDNAVGGSGGNTDRSVQIQAATCATSSNVSGNPTCENVSSSGSFYKFDFTPVPGQEYCETVPVTSDGTTCSCKICFTAAANGEDIASFTSTCLVSKVIIKASDEAEVWSYTECAGGGTSGDTNLAGVTGHDISHVTFCGLKCCVPKVCADLPGKCGSEVPDTCGGTISCGCPSDDNVCTTDTCSDPKNGVCLYTPVICEPKDICEEKPCTCDPTKDPKCTCTPVVCEPKDVCETNDCKCDPTKDPKCTCKPFECKPKDVCEELPCTCDPTKDPKCTCTPVTCTPPQGCTFVKCDPKVGCIYDCPPPPVGNEGCTPGYWKQPQHAGSWGSVPQTRTLCEALEAYCGTDLAGVTLQKALSTGGGGKTALARAAAAAYLNAVNGDVDYQYSIAEINAIVAAAYSGDTTVDEAIALLDGANNAGCPLGRSESPPPGGGSPGGGNGQGPPDKKNSKVKKSQQAKKSQRRRKGGAKR